MPGVHVAPFPKVYQQQLRHGKSLSEEEIIQHTLEDIEYMLKTRTAPADTAAFLIEPVMVRKLYYFTYMQGEGGYIPAPPQFLRGLKEIAKKHDILLIVDEVQSGWGRTGKFFAVEHSGVTPDIMIFAKGSLPLYSVHIIRYCLRHASIWNSVDSGINEASTCWLDGWHICW